MALTNNLFVFSIFYRCIINLYICHTMMITNLAIWHETPFELLYRHWGNHFPIFADRKLLSHQLCKN